jgi:hypothetical protein
VKVTARPRRPGTLLPMRTAGAGHRRDDDTAACPPHWSEDAQAEPPPIRLVLRGPASADAPAAA